MAELTLPTTMERQKDQMPSSLQSLLQKRAFAKKRQTSFQNEHWSVPNVEAKPVETDAVTFTFNINNDTANWNNFYKVCGDLSTKYGERAAKRRAVADNAEGPSEQDKPRYNGKSTGTSSEYLRDSVIEQLLTNEIKTIEQTKSLLNLERIKLQMELLRLLDERIQVANEQDVAAVELLKLWQSRSIQNSVVSELDNRDAAKEDGTASKGHDHGLPLPAPMKTQVEGPSKLPLSTASASLLKRIVQEQVAVSLPASVFNKPTQTRFCIDSPNQTMGSQSSDASHAVLLRQLHREELAKKLGLR